MKRIITFGEIMMRLNPEGYLRFVQAEKFEATYAGGEANVAVSLANYGMEVIDCGVAVLNMHAPWEIAGKVDIYEAYRGYCAFLREI